MSHDPLDRIQSDRKRREIEDILTAPNPAHFQRVYLVGFLRYAVRLSEDEICAIIKKRAKWHDYNEKITRQQVRSVYKRGIAERSGAKGGNAPFKGTKCLSVSSPTTTPIPGKWIGVENAAGFVLEWYRERSGDPDSFKKKSP
jgi:hypothetical protein